MPKVKPSERNYNNTKSLKTVVYEVVCKHGPLRPCEIKAHIISGGLWESASDNISNQVQQALYKLKSTNRIDRGADGYFSLQGATAPYTYKLPETVTAAPVPLPETPDKSAKKVEGVTFGPTKTVTETVTLKHMLIVQKEAGCSMKELRARLEHLNALAEKVGGMTNLSECIDGIEFFKGVAA